jgi:oligopeptide transport system permease protein
MRAYFLKRLLLMIPLLLIISFLAFGLVRVAPGGPFDKDRAPASPEIERTLQAKFHLDEPLWKQYLRYLGVGWEVKEGKFQFFQSGLIRGDLGPSLKYRNHTVNEILAQGLPVTLAIGSLAFCLAMGIGIPLGVYTAVRKGFWDEYAASFFAFLAVCVPALVVGPLLAMIFALRLKWFPVALWGSPLHTILPTITLGLFFAGRISRLMREGMLNTLPAPYILTARAKGLSEAAVLWRHAFPNAVLPVVSYSGPMLADLLTGSFVVETIFQLPGIGVFMVNSSLNKDYTLAVGLVLLYAVLLLVLNLIVDLAYAWLDPRVRYE